MGDKHSFMVGQTRGDGYDPTNRGSFTPNLVGVAMPFEGQEWDDVFGVIVDECRKLKLAPKRVDQYVGSGIVLTDIAKLIEEAEFLIFDLSNERPNVYYELGYAHGVGNQAEDILLIAKRGTQLHYDVSGLRVHFYDSLDTLRKILSRSLTHMKGATSSPGSS